MNFLSSPPIVKLIDFSEKPYDLSVATARTCYSNRGIISPEMVSRTEKSREIRDRIAKSTLAAGHLTTRQHTFFLFTIDRVSRATIWSFLHSHPYYNSEQVSQRYVEVKAENYTIPPLDRSALEIYRDAIKSMMEAYHQLIELLMPVVRKEYYQIFPGRENRKKWRGTIEKKCYELARYILPIATHAFMYHTISGLTLHRYARLCELFDLPLEQKFLVDQMVEAVRNVDANFADEFHSPIPMEETPEFKFLSEQSLGKNRAFTADFIGEFDSQLDGKRSILVDYKLNAERSMANSVRQIFGLPQTKLSDRDAINLVMSPEKNSYFSDPLNLTSLVKITRAMVHPHYTFQKKISHSADSQDQRHRTVPASRPILERHYTGKQDYITPKLIEENEQIRNFYDRKLRELFGKINRLMEMNVKPEYALYLLPNAFPIRFTESGSLSDLHHKWKMRLCYNAQEEIFRASVDEVLAVKAVHEKIGSNLQAPCWFRFHGGQKPFCPEGDRFCGVPVWKLEPENYRRSI